MSDDSAPGVDVQDADAPPASTLLAIGEPHATNDGLELSVLGIAKDAPPAGVDETASTRLILQIRVRNASDAPREFENDFGVLDPLGMVHRRTWANPARYPGALAGVATLAPGQSIEGEAHVLVPGARGVPTAALRPAFLAAVTGCGACDQGVTLFPLVVWQDDS